MKNIETPDWKYAPESPTKSKYTLTGLGIGQKVWIEVAGNNASGKGGWRCSYDLCAVRWN